MGMATIVRTKTKPLKTAVMAMSLAPNVFNRAITLCHLFIVNFLLSFKTDRIEGVPSLIHALSASSKHGQEFHPSVLAVERLFEILSFSKPQVGYLSV
jgi:hypothetical protein